MDERISNLFIREIRLQCDFCIIAYKNIKDLLESSHKIDQERAEANSKRAEAKENYHNQPEMISDISQIKDYHEQYKQESEMFREIASKADKIREESTNNIWYHINSFLYHYANISKLLFPVNRNSEELKGFKSELREKFNIDNDSCFKSRSIRDDFEHFDERMWTWGQQEESLFADLNMGNISASINNFEGNWGIRNFDHNRMAITFKGKELLIEDMIDEINQLKESTCTSSLATN